jgi:phage terminase large subunit-like protein
LVASGADLCDLGGVVIDPLMAMFNAVALMATNPQPAPSHQMTIF